MAQRRAHVDAKGNRVGKIAHERARSDSRAGDFAHPYISLRAPEMDAI
jgi:hypothetical protein